MSEHLNLPKVDCIKKLESVIEAGSNLKASIKQEYQYYVDRDQWQTLPDGLLSDWAMRYTSWEEDVKNCLREVFVAGTSKVTKFEGYRSAMMMTGKKLNDKFRIITDKLSDKLDVLLKLLESIEQGGIHNMVNVNNSQGVVINTGTIEGNITISIEKIQSGGNDALARALNEFVAVVKKETSGEIDQEAMLKQAEILAKQASLPKEQRKATLMTAAWEYIEKFSKVATIGNFMISHGKTIAAFLASAI